MNKITNIEIGYFRVPLEGNLVDALHGKHDDFELITATVYLEDGSVGTGYTYTGGWGGRSIETMLKIDLVPQLMGKEFTTPEEMNQYMCNCIHYVARGGIASFAISALDIAFWDAKLKKENIAIADYFGTRNEKVRTYYGGIDLMFTEEELLANIQKQLDKGHTAVKIKLGKEDEDEDIARVRAVRNYIGKDAMFMVDANMVWTVPQAIRMAKRLEEFDITWLEEPTNPDDYEGYAKIGQATTIPIAMGENLHTKYEQKLGLDLARVKYSIPDCSNVCGITGFFATAKMCEERSLPVSSHGMQELHVNVLGALTNAGFLEYHSFPICDYTVEPLVIVDGYIQPSHKAGVGVEFDMVKLAPYQK
ncbi:MAG: mandelate racemase/muconate lactonizing enzyme family protein [Clostridia bacterium]